MYKQSKGYKVLDKFLKQPKAKIIHIQHETEVKLKILAAKNGKDLKNYIQDLLTGHAEN
jgi:hypothetical protein